MLERSMPTCSVCGKEVQPEATFCPSCGSSLQTSAPPVQPMSAPPQTYRPIPPSQLTTEERMMHMVKRMERVSYVTAGAAAILLITIVLLLI